MILPDRGETTSLASCSATGSFRMLLGVNTEPGEFGEGGASGGG
jgi:hypothetical protein